MEAKSVDLSGHVALVTGSSSGIGAAVALQLAQSGAALIVHGRSPSPQLDSIVAAASKFGGPIQIVTCDFEDSRALPGFADEAWDVFGTIDILVNNAGGDVLTGPMAEANFEEQLRYLWQVDVVTTLMLSRYVGQKMISTADQHPLPSGSRSIVNVGWDQAEQGMAGDAGEMFATTKGAIMSMTRSLAQSLAPQVRVNAVAPGWIRTAWGNQTNEQWDRRARSESLMHRWGCPDDVAATIKFLVSPAARFLSGQILSVNGGFKYHQGKRNESDKKDR